jgi:hypothetical protein
MYVSLYVLGIIVTAAGVAMVGFGIPINEFSLGNTLLISGTTALVGGLVLIALGAAVRQLCRIAEILMARPAPRVARPLDTFDSVMSGNSRPSPVRIPFPPKPSSEGRGPAPVEPRLAAIPSIDDSKDAALDRPRSSFPLMPNAPEPFAERDETPLSPRAPAADARLDVTEIRAEAGYRDMTAGLTGSSDTEVLPISRLDVSLRPAPPSDIAPRTELFESLWPTDRRPSKAPIPEVEPKPAMTDIATGNKADRGEAHKQDEKAGERKQNEVAAEPHVVSILKSGIIDGMAYTLYSDGAIEAELPQGTVRFGSITELRSYLETSS